MSLALSTCVLLISLMHLINGAQFLNATPLSLSSACLVAASIQEYMHRCNHIN